MLDSMMLCDSSEFPLRFQTILANCQTVDSSGKLIVDDVKRRAVREYMYNFSVFPERSILTDEFLWPLRPPSIPAPRLAETTRVSKQTNDSDNEKSRERPQPKSLKRSVPWCATNPTKKRFAIKKIASSECNQADVQIAHFYAIDDNCDYDVKAFGIHFYNINNLNCVMSLITTMYVIVQHRIKHSWNAIGRRW